MAYGGFVPSSTASGRWRVELTAAQHALTDSSMTIRCVLKVHSNYGLDVRYNTAKIAAGASSGASGYGQWKDDDSYLYVSYAGGNSPVTIKTWDVTVPRGETAKTVHLTGSYKLVAVLAGTSTAKATVTVPAVEAPEPVTPDAPTGASVERQSDYAAKVTWTLGENAADTYASQQIERSVNGGAWSKLGTLGAAVSSFLDTTVTPNAYYRYRVRALGSDGTYTDYSATGYVYNTPSAPTMVTASRTGTDTVRIVIDNPAPAPDYVELQRSEDGSTWTAVGTVAPFSPTTDTPGTGTYYYRARNVMGGIASEWSPKSNAVVTLHAPNAPTLTYPLSGMTVNRSDAVVRLQWAHNTVDGSDQTAAQIAYDTGDGEVTVEVEGDVGWYDLSVDFALNAEVLWTVRTMGAADEWGPWAANRVFYAKSAPTVVIDEPSADGQVITGLPMAVSVSYDDPSGELAQMVLVIEGAGASDVIDLGTTTSLLVTSDQWVPRSDVEYVIRAEARSTSTLSASAERTVETVFARPAAARLEAVPDGDAGEVRVTVFTPDPDEGEDVIESVALYRVANGSRVLLADGLTGGSALADRYAPLNVPFEYEAVSKSPTGAVTSSFLPAKVETRWFFFIGTEGTARAMWNPEGTVRATRPAKRRVYYAGRELPVSYDAPNYAEAHSVSFTVRTREEADAFSDLVRRSGGRCVYKSGDGAVLRCDVDVSKSPAWTRKSHYGTVTANLTVIDGGAL